MESAKAPDGKPGVQVESRKQLRKWLESNHDRSSGLWLITYKKESGKPRPDYDDVVEELLCFGWIDSKPNKLDAERSMLWIAPRNTRSAWSRLNKQRIERLEERGAMAPAGIAAVEEARRIGTWSALDAVEDGTIPSDLMLAFDRHPESFRHWEAFSQSSRRAILEWIQQARRPETRASRIEETAELAARGEKSNQWRPKR